jgi:hypothetical protein
MLGHIIEEIGSFLVELFRKSETWAILFLAGVGGTLIFLPVFDYHKILALIIFIIAKLWWFWVFLVLLPIFESLWVYWRQCLFKEDIKWILLEIKIPREIIKSPQGMEQVLRALHSLRNSAGDVKETYWDGEVTVWFSLEMVSFGGQIRLFIRGQKKQRNLIEAAFFSYYQDIEIVEVPDYVQDFPQSITEMWERGLEMWGTEMVLAKPDAYPIKTYPFFESEAEEKQFDPISTFLEILAKIKKQEIVGIQILIAPAGPDWIKKWDKLLDEMQEPETMTVSSGDDETGSRQVPIARTPGQTDVLEVVENNLSKPAFNTLIRFIYFSPKEIYYDSFARRGLVGAFNQYSALNLNSFKNNYAIQTRTRIWNSPYVFPKSRNVFRKQRMLFNYLKRVVPEERFMGRLMTSYLLNWNFGSKRFHMNVEGIATLFHPPTIVVLTAPHIKRVESKKAGPPAGLAIFGEEGEIEQYK